MAASRTPLGAKLRGLRRREGLSQAQLAEQLGISASYLNLIEHNKRPLTAPLLIKLAQIHPVDLHTFSSDEDGAMAHDLQEAFGDPLFESLDLTTGELKDLLQQCPTAAQALLALYRAYRGSRTAVEGLAAKLSDGQDLSGVDPGRLPSEEVNDFIQRRRNHFPELEAAAEALWQEAPLAADGLFRDLVRHLAEAHRVETRVLPIRQMGGALRRYLPERRLLELSEGLPAHSRVFQLAHQAALLAHGGLLDRLVEDPLLSCDESRVLARVALANYFAGAVMMPYAPFLDAARKERHDIELLARRFQASFEQVCHRLTTLQRRGAEGIPFHFLRIDIAGNISKRFSASGIRFARFAGACPRWNVHAAFLTPGRIRTQLSRMPDGGTFFCIARTIRRESGGAHADHAVQAVGLGCEVGFAKAMIYADGLDLANPDHAVPIGVSCRLCDRTDCEQRAFPSLQQPLKIQENLRLASFYAVG
ncbi:MAG TPA: short-chain fatty acyl-CoA regulator family protein [Holophagaceae bacterium]|nr:short-chain fatty acyl-CoA regulator family protein [Holophagaceae bacterium]